MRVFVIVFSLCLVIFAAACGGSGSTNSNANAVVKTGVTPIADSEIAVIEMENAAAFGTIKMELYSNIAPKMVERFKELAKEGFYDGISFHRVNPTVIQAGNPDTKPDRTLNPMKEADSGKPDVPAEFSDVPYDIGIVGAARLGNDINSANSQFFIMLKREAQFDKKYTVFGRVIEGMNNARTIAGAPKEGERPIEPIRIKTIRFEPKN